MLDIELDKAREHFNKILKRGRKDDKEARESLIKATEQGAKLTVEYKESKEKIDFLTKKIDDYELQIPNYDEELNLLRDRVQGFENGILGLPQALHEIREYHAMVDLRDKQISELIQQINSMDKIITGMTYMLDSKLNFDELLEKNETQIKAEEEKRVQIASMELEAKIETFKNVTPVHVVRIYSAQ